MSENINEANSNSAPLPMAGEVKLCHLKHGLLLFVLQSTSKYGRIQTNKETVNHDRYVIHTCKYENLGCLVVSKSSFSPCEVSSTYISI